jgi:dihydrofolate reductase
MMTYSRRLEHDGTSNWRKPATVHYATRCQSPVLIISQSCGAMARQNNSTPVKHFKAIAAMSENRVIGQGNGIPWHLPEDFKWFKKMTTGNIIIMGRKTFESIGRPLPNRETIVLSRSNFASPGVQTANSLNEVKPDERDVFICGGAQIYEQALPLCSDLFLTRVKRVVEGDAFFPEFENSFALLEVITDTPEFRIEHWKNKRLPI